MSTLFQRLPSGIIRTSPKTRLETSVCVWFLSAAGVQASVSLKEHQSTHVSVPPHMLSSCSGCTPEVADILTLVGHLVKSELCVRRAGETERHHMTHPAETPSREEEIKAVIKVRRCSDPADRERAKAKKRRFGLNLIQQFNIKHCENGEEEEERDEEAGEEQVWRGGLIRYEHLACSISGHIALCEDISKQQLHHMTTHRQTDDGL